MALPLGTTGSLWPTFVSARLVSLAVRLASAIVPLLTTVVHFWRTTMDKPCGPPRGPNTCFSRNVREGVCPRHSSPSHWLAWGTSHRFRELGLSLLTTPHLAACACPVTEPDTTFTKTELPYDLRDEQGCHRSALYHFLCVCDGMPGDFLEGVFSPVACSRLGFFRLLDSRNQRARAVARIGNLRTAALVSTIGRVSQADF